MMLKRSFSAVVCMTTILSVLAGWSGAAETRPERTPPDKPNLIRSGDDELNHMRLKVRKGHSQAHLVRLLGEPDYCVGEYLECRYASDKSCITDGLPGVLALVIWFDDNRVGNHEIMCVRE